MYISKLFNPTYNKNSMGNACTPRKPQTEATNKQKIKKDAQAQVRHSSLLISLVPQHKGSDEESVQPVKKQVGCQNTIIKGISNNLQLNFERHVSGTARSNGNRFKRNKTIANLQTNHYLIDERRENSIESAININTSSAQKYPTGSQLSEQRAKEHLVNVQNPSQIRGSVISEWNRSNFNQNILFNPVQYGELFKNSSLNRTRQ